MSGKFLIRKSEDKELVKRLHSELFSDAWEDFTAMWVVWNEAGIPVGFACAKWIAKEKSVFLARAGVKKIARGNGIQRRLIRVRERWAKAVGAKAVITYTLYENHSSTVNLIKSNYTLYQPAYPWVGKVNYFRKLL